MVERQRVRALVRAELEKRLDPSRKRSSPDAAALLEIYVSPECTEDLDFPIRKACIIEPDRPCINSGYCKKLGH